MAGIRFFGVHRTWEDWAGMILGILIVLTPWFASYADNPAIIYNTALIGILVLALAALEIVDLHRWEEGAEFLCGAWLAASPFIFGYANAGTLRTWHFVLGAIVMLLAAAELWQDRKLSAAELARHGH